MCREFGGSLSFRICASNIENTATRPGAEAVQGQLGILEGIAGVPLLQDLCLKYRKHGNMARGRSRSRPVGDPRGHTHHYTTMTSSCAEFRGSLSFVMRAASIGKSDGGGSHSKPMHAFQSLVPGHGARELIGWGCPTWEPAGEGECCTGGSSRALCRGVDNNTRPKAHWRRCRIEPGSPT